MIDETLVSEEYVGDVLPQKTHTVDFLTEKKVMNRGTVPQHYVEGDHEPIIPKELFHRVQGEKVRRVSIYRADTKKKSIEIRGKYSSKCVLSNTMVCAECGQPYRRQMWSKCGAKRVVWRCDNRLRHGSKRCKHSSILKEEVLHEAIITAVNSVVENQGEFVRAFQENVIRIIGSYFAVAEPTEHDSQIKEPQKKMMKFVGDSAKAESADEVLDKEYRIIADEIKELKEKKAKVARERQLAESCDQRMQDMESYMREASYLKKEFNDNLVRRLLRVVRVINESKIKTQFQSDIVMIQRIDSEG